MPQLIRQPTRICVRKVGFDVESACLTSCVPSRLEKRSLMQWTLRGYRRHRDQNRQYHDQ